MEIVCDEEAPQEEVSALNRVLHAYGLPPATPTFGRRSLGDLPWQVLVTGAPFVAFWSTFASKAGEDAYKAVKRWLVDMSKARGDRPGTVTIIDEPTQTWIVLSPDLPEQALRQLPTFDPVRDGGESGYARWDPDRRTWAPPT